MSNIIFRLSLVVIDWRKAEYDGKELNCVTRIFKKLKLYYNQHYTDQIEPLLSLNIYAILGEHFWTFLLPYFASKFETYFIF